MDDDLNKFLNADDSDEDKLLTTAAAKKKSAGGFGEYSIFRTCVLNGKYRDNYLLVAMSRL